MAEVAPPSHGVSPKTSLPPGDKKTPARMETFFVLVIVPLYFCYRTYVAPFMPIMDCDEVYNYWEPLHFILYGSGHQTWEYHTAYALRTYAYLIPLKLITQYIYQPLISFGILSSFVSTSIDPKAQLFVILRQSVAGMVAFSELLWLFSLFKYYARQQPSTIPITTALLLLTCTGMNHAAGALLPSATWMALWCLCSACFLWQWHTLFILCAVTGTLATGWPFGCVCVIPMAIHILYKEFFVNRNVVALLVTIASLTIVVQVIVLAVDFQYYGTITLPTLNIFTYNAGGNGDELYGVEPTSYYIKNLLLNCNILSLLGIVALPVYLIAHSKVMSSAVQRTYIPQFDWNIVSVLLTIPAWLMITVPRPHKEERFMFPLYPVLVYGAVLTVDTLFTRFLLLLRHRGAVPFAWKTGGLALFWIPLVLLSMSRTFALHRYYTAPIGVYSVFSSNTSQQVSRGTSLVCTCGEWYRYPSSFLLPKAVVKAPVGFLPSSFTGQLPQPFTKYGSKKESQEFLQPFNDQNVEQPERYVSDVTHCEWLVDLSDSNDCMAHFPTETSHFTRVVSIPFLDSERTASTLHRTLYIPFMHEQAVESGMVVYKDFTLYKVEHELIDARDA